MEPLYRKPATKPQLPQAFNLEYIDSDCVCGCAPVGGRSLITTRKCACPHVRE